MKKVVEGIEVECVQGDIAAQKDIVAVVNAANAQLRTGGGVAGAIHRAAGPGLEDECKPLAPIKPGEAVITGGQKLPNRYVIHCLGPVYGVDKPEETLLANCYQNALKLAEEHKIESVAFPAISTGYFGYPLKEATKAALKTVIDTIPRLRNVNILRFVLYSENDLKMYERELDEILTT
jgi:O-acetyl-ADP-ribose deacetylase (regulator of RNase III)